MRKMLALALDLERLDDLVLLVLGEEYMLSELEFVPLSAVCARIPHLSINPIREAIRSLKERELIVARSEMRLSPGLPFQEKEVELKEYRITRRGISALHRLEDDYRDKLWAELDPVENNAEQQPDEGDQWEALKLERSSPEHVAMETATEEAIQRIEADNGYAAKEPEERAGIVSILKKGLEAVRSGWASKHVIYALLLQPMRYIAEKFASTGIGEVAKRAVEAIWKIL